MQHTSAAALLPKQAKLSRLTSHFNCPSALTPHPLTRRRVRLFNPDEFAESPEQRKGNVGGLWLGVFSEEVCNGVFSNLALGGL